MLVVLVVLVEQHQTVLTQYFLLSRHPVAALGNLLQADLGQAVDLVVAVEDQTPVALETLDRTVHQRVILAAAVQQTIQLTPTLAAVVVLVAQDLERLRLLVVMVEQEPHHQFLEVP